VSLLIAMRSKFISPQNGTAKTDRSPFVSSVSSILGQSENGTDPSVGSVSSIPVEYPLHDLPSPADNVVFLRRFKSALQTGSLVICGRCERFARQPGQRPDGLCSKHGPIWAAIPFKCCDYRETEDQ